MNARQILWRYPIVLLGCLVCLTPLIGLPPRAQATQTDLPVIPDQSRAPPVPPFVTISLSVTNVILSWVHTPPNTHYQVWRSSAFRFAPGDTGSTLLADMPAICPNGVCAYTDTQVAGGNFAYVVRAFTYGNIWADSNLPVGKFEFAMWFGE